MKKIIFAALGLSFSVNSLATDFFCKRIYEQRIAKLEKRARFKIMDFKLKPTKSTFDLLDEAVQGRDLFVDRFENFHKLTHLTFRVFKLDDEVNPQRARIGLPALTLDEYLVVNPIPAFNRKMKMTALDWYAYNFGLTYEEMQKLILSHNSDETYCPEGKALRIKSFTKTLKAIEGR